MTAKSKSKRVKATHYDNGNPAVAVTTGVARSTVSPNDRIKIEGDPEDVLRALLRPKKGVKNSAK